VLEVVEEEQELSPTEEFREVVGGSDRLGDLRGQELGIRETPQRHPEDAVVEPPDELRCDLEREACLARAARAREREKARPVREHRDELLELPLTADEGHRDDGNVGCVQRPEWREVTLAELEQALCADQILQAVLAEVADRSVCLKEAAGRLGDDDLAAVRGGCNARRPVDVHADVALLGHERLAGVDAHPDLNRPCFERLLRLACGGDGVGRTRERDEERVALGVDLDPVVSSEGLTDHASVLSNEIGVSRSVIPNKARRPFDVCEEERDRPGWKRRSAHRAIKSRTDRQEGPRMRATSASTRGKKKGPVSGLSSSGQDSNLRPPGYETAVARRGGASTA
jgi:hypothetical protein